MRTFLKSRNNILWFAIPSHFFFTSYSSFKSLPEVMSLEQLHLYDHNLSPDAMDSATARDSGTKDSCHGKESEDKDTICLSSSQ